MPGSDRRHVDIDAMLALNEQHVAETSSLDRDGLLALMEAAFHVATCAEAGRSAFLIALADSAAHCSPNFLWFKERYRRFIYVDRIIVAPQARGRGTARHFYEDLFEATKAAGIDRVCCEINIDPPNPASLAFHRALGFREIGTQVLHGGSKTVSYQVKTLA